MWYKKGSWHTLSLRGSEMLPEALATASLWPSWLWSHLMADGITMGRVGPGRGWGRVGMERGVSIRRGFSLGPVLRPPLSRPPLLVGLSVEMLN